MAVNRANAIINEDITLGMKFFKNGQLFDPFSINKVDIYDIDMTTIIQTVPSGSVVKDGIGTYHVTMSGVSVAGTYRDEWFYVPEDGAATSIEVASVTVLDVSAAADEQLQEIIDDIRLDMDDDDLSSPKYTDQQYTDFIKKAAKRIDKYFTVTIQGGSIQEDLTPTQIALLTLKAECLVAKRIFREESGKGLKAKLGPTSIDTTAKFGGISEVTAGASSPCKEFDEMVRNCLLNGGLGDGHYGVGII